MKRLSDVKSLPERDRHLLLDLKAVVLRHVPDAELLVYGSVARGSATAESDYDILILTPGALSSAEEAALDADIYRVQVAKGAVISAVIIPLARWEQPVVKVSPYYKNVTRDAIAV